SGCASETTFRPAGFRFLIALIIGSVDRMASPVEDSLAENTRTILVCSCEDTMALDMGALRRGCRGAAIESGRELCRREIDKARAILEQGTPVTVASRQDVRLSSEIAAAPAASFVNIREAAGWSSEGAKAGPKMAALLAAAAEPMPETALVSLTSEGVILIYGRDDQAIEA